MTEIIVWRRRFM